MRNGHKERHHHTDTRKNDMEAQRNGHLRPGGDKVVHSFVGKQNRDQDKKSGCGCGMPYKVNLLHSVFTAALSNPDP